MAVDFDGFTADPEATVDKGARIVLLAKGCLNEFDAVDGETTKIAGAWDDAASKKYISQINSYRGKFLELQTQVGLIGEVLKRHGNRLIEDRDRLAQDAEDL